MDYAINSPFKDHAGPFRNDTEKLLFITFSTSGLSIKESFNSSLVALTAIE